MTKQQKDAALRQLEEKLNRQELSAEATRAMIQLLKSTPIDK